MFLKIGRHFINPAAIDAIEVCDDGRVLLSLQSGHVVLQNDEARKVRDFLAFDRQKSVYDPYHRNPGIEVANLDAEPPQAYELTYKSMMQRPEIKAHGNPATQSRPH